MRKRKTLSKKLRFEVFKRDKFACQYCGAVAPDALLVIDHIAPVKGGGSDDIVNLITACAPCNGGKSATPLGDNSAVLKSRKQLEDLEERRSQLKLMMEWRRGLEGLKKQTLDELASFWSELCPGWGLTDTGKGKIAKLLGKYSPPEIAAAMSTAVENYVTLDDDGKIMPYSLNVALSKIAGTAWTSKQRAVEPDIDRLFYIRGILRTRLNCGNNNGSQFLDKLRSLRAAGYSVSVIEDAVKVTSSANGFFAWAGEWLAAVEPKQ